MHNHIENFNLVGKGFWASIGEPWDFESSAGRGVLKGVVTEHANGREEFEWLRLSILPFQHGMHQIDQLFAVGRYKYGKGYIEACNAGHSIGSNLFYRVDGKPIAPNTPFLEAVGGEKGTFLVGTLHFLAT